MHEAVRNLVDSLVVDGQEIGLSGLDPIQGDPVIGLGAGDDFQQVDQPVPGGTGSTAYSSLPDRVYGRPIWARCRSTISSRPSCPCVEFRYRRVCPDERSWNDLFDPAPEAFDSEIVEVQAVPHGAGTLFPRFREELELVAAFLRDGDRVIARKTRVAIAFAVVTHGGHQTFLREIAERVRADELRDLVDGMIRRNGLFTFGCVDPVVAWPRRRW